MKAKGLWIGLLLFAFGAGGGVIGTYLWLSAVGGGKDTGQSRAKIKLTRDACCPGGSDKNSEAHHEQHAESGEHDEHEGEAESHHQEQEGKIKLTPEAIQRFGIQVAVVAPGAIEQRMTLPAEIVLNADRVAHLVPRVTGMVQEVLKSVGDRVEAGELLAILESRELTEAKAADLAAEARLKLAEANFKRIQGLLQEKIVSERQYNEAQQAVEESRVAHIETTAKLHALGFTHDRLSVIPNNDHEFFGRYEIKAPFAGTIIDKHATLGEVHAPDGTMFVLADLSSVWLDISIYAQDAARVHKGSKARIKLVENGQGPAAAEGEIFYVSPTLRESTRTGLARAMIDNASGQWRPGMFVTAEVILGTEKPELLVTNEAVQKVEGNSVVFVETEEGYEQRPVMLGKSDGRFTQVLSGVTQGDRYVSSGAFILKAEAGKGAGGHEH